MMETLLRPLRRSLQSLISRVSKPSTSAQAPCIPVRPRRLPWIPAKVRVTARRWRNWAGTLEAHPSRIYSDHAGGPYRSPRTLEELCAIVQEARACRQTVRVFGSSHTWSPLVPTSGFLIDNRMFGAAGGRYLTRMEPGPSGGKARATVPAGVVGRELMRWLWESGYSLPASSVEDAFSVGGMVATATHGVGMDVPSLSDMVVGVTFVDGLGQVRRWTRETATADELAAVQCGLGALGILFDVTLEVEPRYEVFYRMQVVPFADLFADTDTARARLRQEHERNFSVEIYWWPFVFSGLPFLSRPALNQHVWLLTATRDIPPEARRRSALRRFCHLKLLDVPTMYLSGAVMRALRASPRLMGLLPFALCATNVWVSLRGGDHRLPNFEAIHYINSTAVEQILCTAAEWSIPFCPAAPSDAPDGYERVRRSFATLHALVAEDFHAHPVTDPRAAPVNLAIEMRTMAPSSALLSPQHLSEALHHAVRFAVPEVVTSAGQPAWPAFLRRACAALVEDTQRFGTEVRMHLAKEWRELPHRDHPGGMAAYLRAQYQAQGTWQRFLAVRSALDPDGLFLNEALREWFQVA